MSRRPPRSPRAARSPGMLERLERSRDRLCERRVQARARERTIHDAVKRYLRDWDAITACETKRDQDIEALRQQISTVEAQAAREIARYRADQAAAAAVIREQGQSDDDVAELLEISPKQARQLINAARTHPDATPPSAASPQPTSEPATQPADTRERRSAAPQRASNTAGRSAPVENGPLGSECPTPAVDLTVASTPDHDSD